MASVMAPRREPSGKRQRRTVDQQNDYSRKMAELEMSIVLAQPHRKGERSPLAESAIGRFVLRNDIDKDLYEAAQDYARIRGMYQSAIGAPREEHHGGSGRDIAEELVRRWRDSLSDWKEAMLDLGGKVGLTGVDRLLFEDADLGMRYPIAPVKAALVGLGRAMGRI